MRRSLLTRLALIGIVVVFLGGVAGVIRSAASVPDAAGTVYACVNKASGAMRYVTGPGSCRKGFEFEISWNVQGPAGATTKAWYSEERIKASDWVSLNTDRSPTSIITMIMAPSDPPPGSGYLMTANLELVNEGSVDAQVNCNVGNGGPSGFSQEFYVPYAASSLFVTNIRSISLTSISTLGTDSLQCTLYDWAGRPGTAPPTIRVRNAIVTAQWIDQLADQSPAP